MTLASLSPPTVHPYSLYDIRWQPPPAFEISATGSGFLWDQGYNICIDGVNASAGLSYGGLADEPSNTHADIFVSVNSTAVCPPSCLNVGTQALSLVDIYGVPSNSKNFVMDYPAYMLVVSDFTYLPVTPTNVNIIRRVTYEVHDYYSGDTAYFIQVGENFTWGNDWNCNQNPHFNSTSCTQQQPIYTDSQGRFIDQWGFPGSVQLTPSGCGVSVPSDNWQACATTWSGAGQQLPVRTFGTLNGYMHSNGINILGYVTPPQSNSMPAGLRINP